MGEVVPELPPIWVLASPSLTQRGGYEPFMALSERYMFLLMLWDLGWVVVGQTGALGRLVQQVWQVSGKRV